MLNLETAAIAAKAAPRRHRTGHPGRRPRQGDDPARRGQPRPSGRGCTSSSFAASRNSSRGGRTGKCRSWCSGCAASARSATIIAADQGDGHHRRLGAADADGREAAPADALRPDRAIACAAFLSSRLARSAVRLRERGRQAQHRRRRRGFPDLAKQGVLTRKFGQEVIRHIAGKRIHGTGVIPGGMNKALSVAERDSLRDDIDQIVAWSREAVGLVDRLHETNPEFYNELRRVARQHDGRWSTRDGALDFYHGGLRARDADGGPIFDHVDYATYQNVLQEDVKTWSYMKFPYITDARGGKGLVSRRAAGARAELRFHADAAGRSRAQDLPRRRRRQAAARRAAVSTGRA